MIYQIEHKSQARFFSNFLKVGRSFSGVRIIRNIDNLKGVQGYGNLLARTSLIIKC